MNRLPYATALISISLAVILWFIATRFEDESRWLTMQEGTPPDLAMQQPGKDTPVQTTQNITNCEQAEDDLRKKVAGAQSCSADDDCTVADYGYPIQCLTSVAKSEITSLRLEYRNYEKNCAFRVYYDCPSGQARRQAVCRNNRCEVDLVTTDLLQEETLEYLGIEQR
ncbi:MAG: hypothetical protein DRR11_01615 [Gammaproteobacteria bacterium]|nr:MAG: hypothetical protein DRR11_01615 [Gammaproteobacteria bacterium]RLA35571.1 MAG: hypothetical protein DRR15_07190 [Gammaproteobacteria bacterium]